MNGKPPKRGLAVVILLILLIAIGVGTLRRNAANAEAGAFGTNRAAMLSSAFNSASQDVEPAVVAILIHRDESALDKAVSLEHVGSGVIVRASGVVLTSAPDLKDAQQVVVQLTNGNLLTASDVQSDPASGLTVLRIQPVGRLKAARLGNSAQLLAGDWVISVGNMYTGTVISAGIVSGRSITIPEIRRGTLLATDAAINMDNTGGPLVDIHGEVVGLAVAGTAIGQRCHGIGCAIPIDHAKWVLSQLLAHGSVQRSVIGVQIVERASSCNQLHLAENEMGVVVQTILPKSPAATAGLRRGDVLLEIASRRIRSVGQFQEIVERLPPGMGQTIVVDRNGKRVEVDVRPRLQSSKEATGPDADLLRPGLA